MQPSVTLTELRQRLFQLADRVIESGEPLTIRRRGVWLRLVRADAVEETGGRLARLKPRKQSVVVGPPLDPHESPAQWVESAWPKVAEPQPSDRRQRPKRGKRQPRA